MRCSYFILCNININRKVSNICLSGIVVVTKFYLKLFIVKDLKQIFKKYFKNVYQEMKIICNTHLQLSFIHLRNSIFGIGNECSKCYCYAESVKYCSF